MSENVSYSPMKKSTIPSSGGSTAVPEYEQLSDIHQRGVELKTSAHHETSGSGSKVEYEELGSHHSHQECNELFLYMEGIAIITGIYYKSHVDTITIDLVPTAARAQSV